MNKKCNICIKYEKYIDNKINDYLIFNNENLDYVKEILSLKNKYRILMESIN